MQIKTYIAVFLSFLLFAKLFTFDAQLLNVVSGSEALVVVKHSCKLKNFSTSTQGYHFEEAPSDLQIAHSAFCNLYLQFEVADPIEELNFPYFHEFSEPLLVVNSVATQNTSPPPRSFA